MGYRQTKPKLDLVRPEEGFCDLDEVLYDTQAIVLNWCNYKLGRTRPGGDAEYFALIKEISYGCPYVKKGDCPYMFGFGNNLYCTHTGRVEEYLAHGNDGMKRAFEIIEPLEEDTLDQIIENEDNNNI